MEKVFFYIINNDDEIEDNIEEEEIMDDNDEAITMSAQSEKTIIRPEENHVYRSSNGSHNEVQWETKYYDHGLAGIFDKKLGTYDNRNRYDTKFVMKKMKLENDDNEKVVIDDGRKTYERPRSVTYNTSIKDNVRVSKDYQNEHHEPIVSALPTKRFEQSDNFFSNCYANFDEPKMLLKDYDDEKSVTLDSICIKDKAIETENYQQRNHHDHGLSATSAIGFGIYDKWNRCDKKFVMKKNETEE